MKANIVLALAASVALFAQADSVSPRDAERFELV